MEVFKEVTVFSCGYCGKLYYDKDQAIECHSDRTCQTCGTPIGKRSYYLLCDNCRIEKEKNKMLELFNKSTKYTIDEYIKNFPDYYACYDGDRYFMPDDYEYEFEWKDEVPEFVWGTKKTSITLDPESIIQNFEENVEIEDYRMDDKAVESIDSFCNDWNKKYAQDVFYEDTSVAILLK